MIVPEGIIPTKGGGYTSYIFKGFSPGQEVRTTEVLSSSRTEAIHEAKKRLKVEFVELLSFRKW